jgi:hypothetical protein
MLPISWAVATAPVWAPYVALGALFTAAVIKEMVEKRKTADATGSQSLDPSDDLCHAYSISQVDTERKQKDDERGRDQVND